MSNNDQNLRLNVYLPYRTHLLDALKSSSEHYDRGILTLSTAVLGLSIAFIKDIVPLPQATAVSLLTASWFLFALTVLSTLISFLVAHKALSVQLYNADQYYLKSKEDYFNKKNKWSSATVWLNLLSGTLFVSGIVLTVAFSYVNIDDLVKSRFQLTY